jgi:uncharacterized protein
VNASTERRQVRGAAGPLEVLVDAPVGYDEPGAVALRGHALICHPHPVHGGTMDNKVVQTLSRAFTQAGWRAVRFNFRGVGASAGSWDEGRGEIDDAMQVLEQAVPDDASPLAVAGFSFGGYVASQVAARLATSDRLRELVLIAPATASFDVAAPPEGTLVVHGESDDVVALSATLEWARPHAQPVTVVPGGGHFFHGQLPLLKALVLRHLGARAI